jgi:hypothetical protein
MPTTTPCSRLPIQSWALDESRALELDLRRSRIPADRENAEKLARFRHRVTVPELAREARTLDLFALPDQGHRE